VILLLGGTSEARSLAARLHDAGYDVLLSTVSAYGAELAAPAGVRVRSGVLDGAALAGLAAQADAVIDATHPFAEVISAQAAAACAWADRPCLRLERPAADLPPSAVSVGTAAEAARRAVELARSAGGGIFLTVGSRTVGVYVAAARAAGVRVVARVLPTAESLRACAAAGLRPGDVIAMQGPTTAELDAALLEHLGAMVLVTKDSGDAGGLTEKLRAAELAGATAVVVARPDEGAVARTGDPGARRAGDAAVRHGPGADAAEQPSVDVAHTAEEALAWLARLPSDGATGEAGKPRPERAAACVQHSRRGLLQVYTGEGKGKTTAAVGLALRALGAGLTVTFVQFVKGGRESSELAPLRAAGACVLRPAVARSGLLRGSATDRDRIAAAAAWAAAREALSDSRCELVVLDELHAALRHGLVRLDDTLGVLASRPPGQEVVTTGRGAPAELLAAADLVTEMKAVRHPYPGVAARRGVEL
jgi:precorrin-6A/cobalt-precorrin-6A reductase